MLPSVAERAFSVVNDGIYFIPEARHRWEVFHPVSELRHSQSENGRSDVRNHQMKGSLSHRTAGLSCTRRWDESGSDLMLVENFH